MDWDQVKYHISFLLQILPSIHNFSLCRPDSMLSPQMGLWYPVGLANQELSVYAIPHLKVYFGNVDRLCRHYRRKSGDMVVGFHPFFPHRAHNYISRPVLCNSCTSVMWVLFLRMQLLTTINSIEKKICRSM